MDYDNDGTQKFRPLNTIIRAFVRPALKDSARLYDIEAIAENICDFSPVTGYTLAVDIDSDEFWDIVSDYKLQEPRDERTQAEFQALRETVGISITALAHRIVKPDGTHPQERAVRRYEDGKSGIIAPDDVWAILDNAKMRQDQVVSYAIGKYQLALEMTDGTVRVELRYWNNERDYNTFSTDARFGVISDPSFDYMMANATTRRVAAILEDMGAEVTYTSAPLLRLVD